MRSGGARHLRPGLCSLGPHAQPGMAARRAWPPLQPPAQLPAPLATAIDGLQCMLGKCGAQILGCVTDASCKAALDCLSACEFNDQVPTPCTAWTSPRLGPRRACAVACGTAPLERPALECVRHGRGAALGAPALGASALGLPCRGCGPACLPPPRDRVLCCAVPCCAVLCRAARRCARTAASPPTRAAGWRSSACVSSRSTTALG